MLTRRSLVAPAATAVAALALTACSTGPTSEASADPSTSSSVGVDNDAFPTTITHAFGETTVDAEPRRIATVGWNDADVVVSLGVIPVGATKITWGGNADGSTDWFDAGVTELDPDAARPTILSARIALGGVARLGPRGRPGAGRRARAGGRP